MTVILKIIALFSEGLISFFSPCVLPLIPLYMGYLTSDTVKTDELGNTVRDKKRTFIQTLAFVIGICSVFFIAGLGVSAVGSFFKNHRVELQIVGGIMMVVMGLVSLNIIQIPLLKMEKRFSYKQGKSGIVNAYLMGFFFSFAWTPCVGPMLASALVEAANASTKFIGFVYLASYSLGFVGMFIVLGFFTDYVLDFLKKSRNYLTYIQKIGGVLIIVMGLFMLNSARVSLKLQNTSEVASEQVPADSEDMRTDVEKYGFHLEDKDGNTVHLEDYKGEITLINFFGTWCHYCNEELPNLQKIHETRSDVKVILVALPGQMGEGDISYVEDYMSKRGYTMPIVYDKDGRVSREYGVSGYPTTFIMKKDGNFLGYIPGYITEADMEMYLKKASE